MHARMEFAEDQILSYDTADIHGFTPDQHMIGDMITHTKDGNPQYVIIGFQWMGHTDEWGYKHVAIFEFGIELVRPLNDLYGTRHTGERRYQEWEAYGQYILVEAEVEA